MKFKFFGTLIILYLFFIIIVTIFPKKIVRMIKIECEKTLYYSNDDEIMIKAIYNNANNIYEILNL